MLVDSVAVPSRWPSRRNYTVDTQTTELQRRLSDAENRRDWELVGELSREGQSHAPTEAWWFGAAVRALNALGENVSQFCREVLADAPGHPWATGELLRATERERLDSIELALRSTELHGNNPSVLATSAWVLLGANQLDAALRAAERALEIVPTDGGVVVLQIRILAELRRWGEIVEVVRRATRSRADDLDAIWEQFAESMGQVEAPAVGQHPNSLPAESLVLTVASTPSLQSLPEATDLAADLSRATESSDWQKVLTIADAAAAQFPDGLWWFGPRVQAMREVGAHEKIEKFCRRVIDASSEHVWAYRELFLLLQEQGRTAEAAEAAEECIDWESGNAALFSVAGWVLESASKPELALRASERAVAVEPLNGAMRGLQLRLLGTLRRWEDVETGMAEARAQKATPLSVVWDQFVNAASLCGEYSSARMVLVDGLDAPEAASSAMALFELERRFGRFSGALEVLDKHCSPSDPKTRLDRASILTSMGRLEDAETLLQSVAGHDVDVTIGFARIAELRFDLEEAVSLWASVVSASPENHGHWRSWFSAMTLASRFEEAETALQERFAGSDESNDAQLCRAILLSRQLRFDEARPLLDKVLESDAPKRADRALALTLAGMIGAVAQDDVAYTRRTRTLFASEVFLPPTDLMSLARLQIALDEHGDAIRTIADIPEEMVTYETQVLRSWVLMRTGDAAGAKESFHKGLEVGHRLGVHSAIHQLDRLSSSLEIRDGEVIVFATCRDEELRVEDFLRHYRALGVDGFVIVDNGSIDGTARILAAQPDVQVYYTEDDYVQACVGVRWLNELISQLDTQNWCLFADIDELLIFPECENRSIHEFVAMLDERGFEAAGGFMVDMHAATLSAGKDYQAGASMLEAFPFFANNYSFQSFELSPYTNVRGGLRDTSLDTRHLQMTKTPLIRSDAGISYLSSSHETTPARVAKLACLFLHFKFIGDALDRHRKESEWTSHNYWGNNLRVLETINADQTLAGEHTLAFESSDQLVELGLLNSYWGSRR